jgi:hypothetical protein
VRPYFSPINRQAGFPYLGITLLALDCPVPALLVTDMRVVLPGHMDDFIVTVTTFMFGDDVSGHQVGDLLSQVPVVLACLTGCRKPGAIARTGLGQVSEPTVATPVGTSHLDLL